MWQLVLGTVRALPPVPSVPLEEEVVKAESVEVYQDCQVWRRESLWGPAEWCLFKCFAPSLIQPRIVMVGAGRAIGVFENLQTKTKTTFNLYFPLSSYASCILLCNISGYSV